jgi:membrane-associated protein
MIHTLVDFLRSLTSPDGLRQLLSQVFSGWIGYAVLCGIVFSETGLLVGFFLPGDSLLFTVGVVAGDGALSIWVAIVLLSLSAMIGDSTGYFLGRRTGQAIFSRPDSRLFKREHLLRTKAFYERHGGKTIMYARFVPIVRTFTAFVAGVAEMPYRSFLPYSICGGIGWVFLCSMAGYLLGSLPFVRQNFEKVIVGIILLSLVPTLLELRKSRAEKAGGKDSSTAGVV